MSEEQPNFKVTDRRLFNADGTPREQSREEATTTTATTQNSKSSVADAESAQQTRSAAATVSAAQTSTSSHARTTANAKDVGAASGSPPSLDSSESAGVESDTLGADDPASFVNFLMSIASNAAAALGMMEHPVTGERAVDLQLGKHWIDVLGMLQQKTHGNLQAQEQRILEGLLADLRMQYVSLTSAGSSSSSTTASMPRGFTGRDITGGR
jgi:cobalamin biosynthesis Mg chelatase CobN